eukprot:5527151-Pyramimonas_sp.AAC.1
MAVAHPLGSSTNSPAGRKVRSSASKVPTGPPESLWMAASFLPGPCSTTLTERRRQGPALGASVQWRTARYI